MALPRMAGRGAARVLLVTVITQLAIVPFVMAQLEPAPAPTIGTPPPPPGRPPPGNPPPALPPPGHPPPARSPPGNPPPGHPPPALPPPGSPGAIPGSDESGSKLNVGAIVGGVIGGALATVLVILGVLWCLLKKKERELANGGGDKTLPTEHAPPTHAPGVSAARRTPLPKPDVQVSNAKVPAPRPAPVAAPLKVNRLDAVPPQQAVAYNVDVRRYSYAEVVAISSNWAYKLGEGGFGSVYYGQILSETASGEPKAGPQLVALKRLSATSQQGKNEFLNEVRLLSRIHHRYLVSLLGFCDEINSQVLIYEYVQEGSLANWLHGANQGHPDFNWYCRLLIALHAALGLEYLHVGARPNITHRDVKSSNILITKEWEGRVADFGLSKTGVLNDGQQGTPIITLVKGTRGYLDPEYIRTGKLTTKSDVYSFGIVLLELVTGRIPIDHSQGDPQLRCIENYVQSHYPHNLATIADPNLNGNYDMRSMKKIVHVALRSVALQGMNRPSMSDVVGEIRSAMKLMELGDKRPASPAAASTYTQDFQNPVLSEIVAEIPRTPAPIAEPGRPARSGRSNEHHTLE